MPQAQQAPPAGWRSAAVVADPAPGNVPVITSGAEAANEMAERGGPHAQDLKTKLTRAGASAADEKI